jgi:hypothetical protein
MPIRKSNFSDDGPIAAAVSSASLLKNCATLGHARKLCISSSMAAGDAS